MIQNRQWGNNKDSVIGMLSYFISCHVSSAGTLPQWSNLLDKVQPPLSIHTHPTDAKEDPVRDKFG